MSKKYLYLFKEGHDAFGGDQTTMKNILGGKGAGLAEMTHAGMPVPQGFTITTEACTQYYADNREINDEIKADIFKYMGILEEQTGKKFGDIENPLLVSVRSGARQSMPGMMDTILNLGLNDQSVEGLAKKTDNPRFAYDCYRRFIQMYSDVVMELGKSFFEERIDAMKERKGVTQDVDLDADDLKELVKEFKAIYLEKQGSEFPQDPKEQLIGAVKAVFRSWDNPRANVYRKMNEIPYEWGTAVNVQQMAFGNSGMRSGTGVAFTRNPATGEKKLSASCMRRCPTSTTSSSRLPPVWRATTATCRIWSSPSRTASCSCCRPVTASAPPRLPCRSPATWWTRASSPSARLCCALSPSSWTPCCIPSLTPPP